MVSEKTNVNYYLQYKKLTDKNEKKKFLENFFEIFEKQSNCEITCYVNSLKKIKRILK